MKIIRRRKLKKRSGLFEVNPKSWENSMEKGAGGDTNKLSGEKEKRACKVDKLAVADEKKHRGKGRPKLGAKTRGSSAPNLLTSNWGLK